MMCVQGQHPHAVVSAELDFLTDTSHSNVAVGARSTGRLFRILTPAHVLISVRTVRLVRT